jgi:FkbM family methyltransferase
MKILKIKMRKVLAKKHPIKYMFMRALKSSRLCLFFHIDRNTYRLRFFPSALSGELWYEPDLRIADEQFFKRYIRPGDIVIDVGANIGELTLQASVAVGQTGMVIAIEAHPRIFKYLVGNIDFNRAVNVQLYNCALGNADGTIKFSDSAMDDVNAVVKGDSGISVPLCKLDNLPIEAASIALLKVDVEGFEKFVFEGAERILQTTKCIYFESWDDNYLRYGYSSNDLIEWLKRSGFTIYRILGPDSAAPIERSHCSQTCENLVAVKDNNDFFERTAFKIKN